MSESKEMADTNAEDAAATLKSEAGEAPPASSEEQQSTGETKLEEQQRLDSIN